MRDSHFHRMQDKRGGEEEIVILHLVMRKIVYKKANV